MCPQSQQHPDDGQFNSPSGVAVDSSGNVYVADRNNDRVEKFTSNGTYLTQWSSRGSGNGQINRPSGIAVDPSGNVYVADTGNNRVQKFGSVATISVDQTVLIIVIALIVGSVGAYLTMRKLPKKLWNRS